MHTVAPPQDKNELMKRVQAISGKTLADLSRLSNMPLPACNKRYKGWLGVVLERILGASAGSLPVPDFPGLRIELKTLPLGENGTPSESTFVSSIHLLSLSKECWEESSVFKKLQQVLWVPYESSKKIPFAHRRIGMAKLWQPTSAQRIILKQDWLDLSDKIVFGRLHELSALEGEYLQVRPKAANGQSLCQAFDENGERMLSLPRGFYLRASFTRSLFSG